MSDLDVIVLFAVRYALPRIHTSAAYSLLAYILRHSVDGLSVEACEQIKREILAAQQTWGKTGVERDWTTILRLLDRRIEQRGKVAL